MHPSRSDFFFFWCLFVFQNNLQYHLESTFHSELISCCYSASTAHLLLKTGWSSWYLNMIATEGTYHRYRLDESYLAFVTSTVSKVLDILEIRLTMQILHHWHWSMVSKVLRLNFIFFSVSYIRYSKQSFAVALVSVGSVVNNTLATASFSSNSFIKLE